MTKSIFADESYRSLDHLTSRTLFCYVEFDSDDNLSAAKDTVAAKILNDRLRFDTGGKVHYSSFTPAQKSSACDIISKLSYRCKIFVRYDHSINSSRNEAGYKRELLKNSLRFMTDKQTTGSDIMHIENAKGIYSSVTLPDNVHLINNDHHEPFLIADVVLGVFCDYLDRGVRGQQAITNYTLIKEKVRLQVIDAKGYRPSPLSRGERI